MKDIVKKNNKLVVVLLIVLIIIMGSSFAWLSNEKYGTNISYIRAKDLGDGKIKLIDCNEDLTLENAVPISTEKGLAQEKSCKVVIDNTKNDVDLEYTIYLDDKKIDANEERMLDKYVRYSFTSENEEETAENTKLISATGTNPNRILKTDYVRQKEQKVYYLKVWMDYDADQNAMNKVFSTKLRVEITQQRAQVLTIDPNGGTYKGDSKKVIEKLDVGEEKILEEPKYEGYTFRGWEISNNTTKIENNKLIMGKGDTTITATWNISEDSVARINNKYYTSLKNAIDAALENDTITIIKNIDETVINNKKIAIDLNGFTINGQKDTTITNNGDLTIKGKGTINNNEGTALDNNGTLTLGEDDGEVKKEDININGKIGIDQKKIFNFYDGTITGKIGINGSTTTKPEGYFVFVDHDEKTNTQKVYLITKTTSAVAMLDNVLYMNLQDAINVEEMMQAGKSIGIIRDCELAYTISIEKGKNIVIDIEGKNVATGYTITNNGNLTIKDSSKEKGILKPSTTIINNGDLNISDISIIETTDSDVIENKNNLMINSSTITALNSYVIKNSGSLIMLDDNTKLSSNKYALYNNSENTSTIRGGTVSGIYNEGNLKVEKVSIIDTNNSNYIVNSTKDIQMDSVTISNVHYGIRIESGTALIQNSTISSDEYSVTAYRGTTTLQNNTINANGYGVRNEYGKVNILGGNYTSKNKSSLYIYGGSTTINDGIFTGKTYAIDSTNGSGGGVQTINGGTINGFNLVYHTVVMNDGIINGQGLNIQSGNFNLLGGKISGSTYGIKNNNGEITLGSNENEVDTTNPIVIGETYGIYTTGRFNFYDGKVYGKTEGYYGEVSATTDSYEIINGSEEVEGENYNYSTLSKMNNFVKVGNIEFNSLQKAIDSIDTEGTVTFIDNGQIKGNTEVPTGKNITINLSGYKLTTTKPIINSGVLSLKDESSNPGGIVFNIDTGDAITNKENATLNINNISINANIASYQSSLIENSGTTNIEKLEATVPNSRGIYNSKGSLVVNNTKLNVKYYALYINKGTVNIKDNEFKTVDLGIYNISGNIEITGGSYTSTEKNAVYIYGGSTTINDGIFTGKTYAIDSTNGSGGGVQTINGGTINGFNLVYHTVVMNDGIINGQGLNIQSGNFNLLGGKISGSTYGIKNNNGEITLGNNENEVDTTNPIVIGETYGIYTTGRFNFYDGKVYGKTEGYYGEVSATTDSYEIINGSEEVEGENYNYSTLSKMNNFVKVGNIEFNSLQKAIDSIDTEGTVTFIDNGQIKGNTEVPTGKNITINLSGYKLTTTKPIINSGVLSLKDESSNPGGIVFNIDTGDAITNKENATLNINNISINANIASYQSSLIENSGTTNIEKLEATVPNSRGIYNSKGSLVVNNTKLNVKYYALYINKGTVNIKDNEFKTVDLGIYNISGNIEIMGGSYTSTEKNAVYIYGGSTTINDGIFTGKTYAIASTNGSGGGVQTINGGTINGFNLVYHTVVMNDGIINGQGLNIQSGNFSLLGGKILGSTYGIKNNNGEITLGSNENEVDTTNPIVIGETYGIYTITGNFNFYDGKIYGKTAGYYGTISTLADNFMMDASTETINNEVYITNYLSEQGNIIQNGDKQYKNVQTAIDESTNGDTLTFIDDTLIHYPLTVSNDDNITLDLAGHNVKMTKTITNLGTLNIIDTLNSGSINLLNSVKLFVNSGILKISNISITNDVTTSSIINSSGSSKLNLENINMTSLNGIVIGNDSIATIDNSNITVQNSSLITSSGSININNGTYKAPTVIYQNQSTLDSSIMATIIGTNQSIYNYSNSFSVNKSDLTGQVINSKNLTLSNTTINSNIRNNNNSNLEINNNSIVNLAKLTSALAGLYNAGSTTINDVTLNSSINNLNYSTTYQIENRGTLNATRLTSNITDFPTINRREVYGIYNNGGEANLNEYNAIINDESINAAKIYGIYNANNAKVNFNSGTLSIYGGRETYGIYSGGSNSNIKMLSGNILVNQAILGYGIYINNGEVILGSQDGKVSITDPSISSICSTTGVGIRKVNGYLKYYDGKILGSTSAKPETTTDVEYGYEARNHKDESGNDYCILEYME